MELRTRSAHEVLINLKAKEKALEEGTFIAEIFKVGLQRDIELMRWFLCMDEQ